MESTPQTDAIYGMRNTYISIHDAYEAMRQHARRQEQELAQIENISHGFKLCFPYAEEGNIGKPALFKDGGYYYYVPEVELQTAQQQLVEAKAFEAYVQKFGDYRKAFAQRHSIPPPPPRPPSKPDITMVPFWP